MFDVGELVVFGSDGVCQVESVGALDMAGISKDRMYYTLIPLGKNGNGRIYAPVDGKKVTIRRVISLEDANKLIDEIKHIDKLEIIEIREPYIDLFSSAREEIINWRNYFERDSKE